MEHVRCQFKIEEEIEVSSARPLSCRELSLGGNIRDAAEAAKAAICLWKCIPSRR
jgi:hypothetical protein